MKNKWELGLLSLADEFAGSTVQWALMKWSDGEGSHVVRDAGSFASALAHVGLELPRIAENVERVAQYSAMRELLAHRADGKPADFYMLYREGGRAPTHKHADIDDARREAKRIANESGETVHVLAKAEAVTANAAPTVEDVREHEAGRLAGSWGGMWMVVCKDKYPQLVACFVGESGEILVRHIAGGCVVGPIGAMAEFDRAAKWFPLTPDGKPVKDDSIPF